MNSTETMERTDLLLALEQIAEGNDIQAAVAREALSHEEPSCFFDDLMQHGCSSGLVSCLIYYHDTHAFFDSHYKEIEDLREEWELNMGVPVQIQGDLKNWLAWFAFEEVAYRIATDRELI